jgi:drug/metabolite transporter (DMT)-like permease
MNLLVYIWLAILIGDFAKKAMINPGLIYGCLSSIIIFNCIFTYVLFNEKITIKMCSGIAFVIAGVVWISIAKNNYSSESPQTEE